MILEALWKDFERILQDLETDFEEILKDVKGSEVWNDFERILKGIGKVLGRFGGLEGFWRIWKGFWKGLVGNARDF